MNEKFIEKSPAQSLTYDNAPFSWREKLSPKGLLKMHRGNLSNGISLKKLALNGL
jgi:hypothetical protein